MNSSIDPTRPVTGSTQDLPLDDTGSGPAGDVRPFRSATAGIRVALLLGVTTIATVNAAQWTTISAPGGGC